MASSYQASSSSLVSSVKNKGPWIINCGCGDVIKYSTSKSNDNPGRRYKAFPNYKDKENKGCRYFRWLDKKVAKVGSVKTESSNLEEVEKLGKKVNFLAEIGFFDDGGYCMHNKLWFWDIW